MKLTVNPGIFENFDNPRIGVTIVKGADNRADLSSFEPQLESLCQELEEKYGQEPVSQLPKIAAWREAYRAFGVKAKDYPSSIEALYKRVTKGGRVGGINPLVDIYNYISLKYMMPAGGEDTDKMMGDLQLTYASDSEKPVTVLGKDEAQAPSAGEIVWKDDEGTICRRWNWREVARTILDNNTANCILVLEALNPVTDTELQAAQTELGQLIERHCGGSITHLTLTKGNPEIAL